MLPLFFLPHQIQSELSDFHLNANYTLEMLTLLGNSYLELKKCVEARKVMEEALKVCLELGEDKAAPCAAITGDLGLIYK